MSSKVTIKSDTPKNLEFFIFHRNGTCLLHLDFIEENIVATNKAINASANKENEHRYKLLFGMLFSMKSFVKTLSPKKGFDFLKSFSTTNFKLHYVEFLNGLRFCLMTTPTDIDLGNELRKIHRLYYTSLISKNVFCSQEEQIKNEIFLELVNTYFKYTMFKK